jgi:hypothetical protein
MTTATVTTVTFGDAFYGILSNAINPTHTDVMPHYETRIVHDPFCTRSLMMHAMVDTGCMIHETVVTS